jgi:hypothetical protein
MGGGMMSSTTASIPMHPAIRKNIEAGNGWTESKELSCKVCDKLAHCEDAGSRRVACYECNTVTFIPDACFFVLRPLEIHPDTPLPKPEEIDWHKISEVQVYGRLNDAGKAIVDAALTNKTRRVKVHANGEEAFNSVDHFVT